MWGRSAAPRSRGSSLPAESRAQAARCLGVQSNLGKTAHGFITEHDAVLALVHDGWNHLMSQRPLAAWGTWQRALQIDPGSVAARQALQTLEAAPDLPAAARKVYRFRKPTSESQRQRWDEELGKEETGRIEDPVDAFGRLSELDPEDADSWFNRGLCLAWAGRDQEAIECLGQVVSLEADKEPRKAAEAWTLAEILRQGGGAENLSDDLRFACNFTWNDDDTPRLEESFVEIRRIPARAIPASSTTSRRTSSSWNGSIAPFPRPTPWRQSPTCPTCWPRSTSRRGRSGFPVLGWKCSRKSRRSSAGSSVPAASLRPAWRRLCHFRSWTRTSGPPGCPRGWSTTWRTGWPGKRSRITIENRVDSPAPPGTLTA